MTQSQATTVAYPEPTPVLRGKEARQFLWRLEHLKMTPEQREQYRSAREFYRAMVEKTKIVDELERARKARAP